MNNKIYVGNLSFNIKEETLREEFEKYGAVSSCKLIMDRDTGRCKGFAFVEMESTEAAQSAIGNLNEITLEGRSMKVNEAIPQDRGGNHNYRSNRW